MVRERPQIRVYTAPRRLKLVDLFRKDSSHFSLTDANRTPLPRPDSLAPRVQHSEVAPGGLGIAERGQPL